MNFSFIYSTLLLLSVLHRNEAGGAQFLRSVRRLGDSNMYDSYYCCNICGPRPVLVWTVDGANKAVHQASDSAVGSVASLPKVTNTTDSLTYSSMIVSRYPDGNNTCLDVIMVATQSNRYWKPVVVCQGSSVEYNVTYNDDIRNFDAEPIVNGDVTANVVVAGVEVVTYGSDYRSAAIICRSRGTELKWQANGIDLVSFERAVRPGENFRIQSSQNNPVVLVQTVVIESTTQEITSLLIANELLSGDLNISCGCSDNLGEVFFPVNQLIYTSSIRNSRTSSLESVSPTLAASTSFGNGLSMLDNDNHTSTVAGSTSLKPYFAAMVMCIITAMKFASD